MWRIETSKDFLNFLVEARGRNAEEAKEMTLAYIRERKSALDKASANNFDTYVDLNLKHFLNESLRGEVGTIGSRSRDLRDGLRSLSEYAFGKRQFDDENINVLKNVGPFDLFALFSKMIETDFLTSQNIYYVLPKDEEIEEAAISAISDESIRAIDSINTIVSADLEGRNFREDYPKYFRELYPFCRQIIDRYIYIEKQKAKVKSEAEDWGISKIVKYADGFFSDGRLLFPRKVAIPYEIARQIVPNIEVFSAFGTPHQNPPQSINILDPFVCPIDFGLVFQLRDIFTDRIMLSPSMGGARPRSDHVTPTIDKADHVSELRLQENKSIVFNASKKAKSVQALIENGAPRGQNISLQKTDVPLGTWGQEAYILDSKFEFEIEGLVMTHCIGGPPYTTAASAGTGIALSLRENNNPRATAYYRETDYGDLSLNGKKWSLSEFYGPHDHEPSESMKEFLAKIDGDYDGYSYGRITEFDNRTETDWDYLDRAYFDFAIPPYDYSEDYLRTQDNSKALIRSFVDWATRKSFDGYAFPDGFAAVAFAMERAGEVVDEVEEEDGGVVSIVASSIEEEVTSSAKGFRDEVFALFPYDPAFVKSGLGELPTERAFEFFNTFAEDTGDDWTWLSLNPAFLSKLYDAFSKYYQTIPSQLVKTEEELEGKYDIWENTFDGAGSMEDQITELLDAYLSVVEMFAFGPDSVDRFYINSKIGEKLRFSESFEEFKNEISIVLDEDAGLIDLLNNVGDYNYEEMSQNRISPQTQYEERLFGEITGDEDGFYRLDELPWRYRQREMSEDGNVYYLNENYANFIYLDKQKFIDWLTNKDLSGATYPEDKKWLFEQLEQKSKEEISVVGETTPWDVRRQIREYLISLGVEKNYNQYKFI